MKILLCHNYYKLGGGESNVFDDETRLLRSYGHEVIHFTLHNSIIDQMNPLEVSVKTLWNQHSYNSIRSLIKRERPRLMHCTNIFPLISPAAYYAARAENLPVVQSLHNFRLFCTNGMFFRKGRVCEECMGKAFPYKGILYGCYRESRKASAVVATMLGLHRALRTWVRTVDIFVALTEFARQKFIQGMLPADKVLVKPNFVYPDPGPGAGRDGYAVYVGRLSEEKGVSILLDAWAHLSYQVPLKVFGDGPLAERVRSAAANDERITWLSWRPVEEVLSAVGKAMCLILPSIWYEGLPKVLIEAFAKGTPVIASHIGNLAKLVDDGRTGLHFTPGDSRGLSSKVKLLFEDPEIKGRLREGARKEFELKYMAESNYRTLMSIYEKAELNKKGLGRRGLTI